MPTESLAGVAFIKPPGSVENPQLKKIILEFQGDYQYDGGIIKPAVQIKCLGALNNSSTIPVNGTGISSAGVATLQAAYVSTSTCSLTYGGTTYTVHIESLSIRQAGEGSSHYSFDASCRVVASY